LLRFGEALTLACIAGCAAARAALPRPLRIEPRLFWVAAALLTAALISAILNLVTVAGEHPERTLLDTLGQVMLRDYLQRVDPVAAALLFTEGLLLLLLAADICSDVHRRDAMLRMLVVGASAAALLNLLRLVVAAVAQEHPWTAFAAYFASVRVAINFVDVNAAGSYFLMMLFVAAGLALRAWRFAPGGIMLTALGLWISGSRVALAAALVTTTLGGVIVVIRQSAHRKAMAAALLAAVAVIALAGWKWYPQGRNVNTAYALSFRMEMARAALKLTRTAPLFGVGLGRFQPLSAQYASIPENAHNNFLQVMAELGLPGLVLFAGVIGFALRQECRRVNGAARAWGLLAGLAAFLLTCIGGHPLLVPPAAYAFWIALGVAGAAWKGDDQRGSRRVRLAAVAVIGFFIATIPFRTVAAVRSSDLEHATIGFARVWQSEPDGLRYRWAGAQCTFFVSTSARAFAIPLRAAPTGAPIVEVSIMIDGRDANRVRLGAGEGWRTVRLELAPRTSARFSRVDLEARVPGTSEVLTQQPTDTSGALMVGRPQIAY
jgi:O-antigen ligase